MAKAIDAFAARVEKARRRLRRTRELEKRRLRRLERRTGAKASDRGAAKEVRHPLLRKSFLLHIFFCCRTAASYRRVLPPTPNPKNPNTRELEKRRLRRLERRTGAKASDRGAAKEVRHPLLRKSFLLHIFFHCRTAASCRRVLPLTPNPKNPNAHEMEKRRLRRLERRTGAKASDRGAAKEVGHLPLRNTLLL